MSLQFDETFLLFLNTVYSEALYIGENGYQGAVLGFRFYNRTIKTSFPFRYSASSSSTYYAAAQRDDQNWEPIIRPSTSQGILC